MQGTLLAVITPDNTPHGYNLSFAFPMVMFIVIATVLYLVLFSAHSVPGHVAMESSRWARGSMAAASGSAAAAAPRAGTAGPATSDADATQTVQHEPDETAEGGA